MGFIQLDYAFQPFNNLGAIHRFSGLLRWDGPWVAGGEPNAPKYVTAREVNGGMEVRWDKAHGPARGYQVTLEPLDGRQPITTSEGINPIYRFKNLTPDTLYRVTVKTIGFGGNPSFASEPFYLQTAPVYRPEYQAKSPGADRSIYSQNLFGQVDGVGLRLSWTAPRGMEPTGYYLYRKSPSGKVVRVTQEAKTQTRLWVTDTSGLEGTEWIVTALGPGGKNEKIVGIYYWYPTAAEVDYLSQSTQNRLFASPEPKHRVFLDWDNDPRVEKYSVFVSYQADGVYEYLRDVSNSKATLLIHPSKKHERFHFLVAPKDDQGTLLKRSNEAVAELSI